MTRVYYFSGSFSKSKHPALKVFFRTNYKVPVFLVLIVTNLSFSNYHFSNSSFLDLVPNDSEWPNLDKKINKHFSSKNYLTILMNTKKMCSNTFNFGLLDLDNYLEKKYTRVIGQA